MSLYARVLLLPSLRSSTNVSRFRPIFQQPNSHTGQASLLAVEVPVVLAHPAQLLAVVQLQPLVQVVLASSNHSNHSNHSNRQVHLDSQHKPQLSVGLDLLIPSRISHSKPGSSTGGFGSSGGAFGQSNTPSTGLFGASRPPQQGSGFSFGGGG